LGGGGWILAFAASNINIPTCLVKLLTHTVTTASLSDIICVIAYLASSDPPLHVVLFSNATLARNLTFLDPEEETSLHHCRQRFPQPKNSSRAHNGELGREFHL